MNILDKIVNNTKREIQEKKKNFSIKNFESSPLFKMPTISLVNYLLNSNSGIIAEHKRRSPSKKNINNNIDLVKVVKGYQDAKVCGVSILTDKKYFGGSLDDLKKARQILTIPILRKEFIIDEFQIIESRANGADVILLIASILSKEQIKKFSELAKSLSLEVLIEIHNEKELNKSINPNIDLIGINNRNLKTLKVDLNTFKKLSPKIPDNIIKICESGISSNKEIKEYSNLGADAFLIGESLMKSNNIYKETRYLINK